ncbi:MAG: S8 family serine peptidase [Candidatus Sulfopaludibacter sp.]|nr:S8 family serine peptidase [Candidatus Sulfopaludibacter sp.]
MRKYSLPRLARVVAILVCLAVPAAAAQYIMQIAAGADISQVTARYGLAVVRPLSDDGHTLYLVSGPDPAPPNFVKTVLTDPSVREFEPDERVQSPETQPTAPVIADVSALTAAAQDLTTVPYYGATLRNSYVNQPAGTLIGLPAVLQSYATGAGVVAVIDTGVDPNHPALQGVLVPGYDFTRNLPGIPSELDDLTQSTVAILDQSTVAILDRTQCPYLLNQSTVAILDQSTVAILDGGGGLPEDFGHGTMVAGLIHLVAPTARIMPLKAFHADGTANLSDIVRAIYFAVDNGAGVINMSFSSRTASTTLAAAVQYAWSHNVICVASAGNDGREGVVVHPAADKGTLGVGSTTDLDQRSSFSNYDSPSVRMAAPGDALVTTYPGNHYAGVWGTSFSTALTSGAAALLLQLAPKITVGHALSALEHGQQLHIDADMGDGGRLDVYSAILYCLKKD